MTQVIHWNAEALWEAVAPQLPGFTVEILPSVDSSNTELMRRARSGDTAPTLLVAEQQTAGRGRMGKPWASSLGDSLMFSLGLPLAPSDWSGLSLAVGQVLAEALQPGIAPIADSPSATPRIGIKWPNDLWLEGDRKLAGILIETAHFGGHGPRQVIVGVGINVRPRHEQGLSTPPACLQDLDPRWDAPAALAAVIPALVNCLQRFETQGFAPFQPAFAQRDLLRGRPVRLSDGTQGMAEGVGLDGALLVRTAQGLERITSAEVSVRPQTAATAG
ncbi:biotin--[acetyl-CoA-carboxylase] ligase [Comamonas sp. GB3 AK4-5]|uniref:biotin--[acetyl-CoA-carboxylase] ligase n=1 Tax=Comamonas sp. GB3 AK4-5 TaxID=3231487 RepID=UPI00351E2586